MQLKRITVAAGLLLAATAHGQSAPPPAAAGPGDVDVDFLLNYYDQDGDRSPVTGGIGTEDLQVVSPVFIVNWKRNDRWSLRAELGVDSITSASTDNIDFNVSSASRVDTRAYTAITASRAVGDQTVGFTLGLSNEYDYQSASLGVSWSRSLLNDNVSVSASLRHYADTITLYDIDGVDRGDDDRSTTDLTLGFTQVLGSRTWAAVELYLSDQSGFLSTPFHEVILAPTAAFPDGRRVAERLPDSRLRTALGLRVNHSISKRFVVRVGYRFYDDDWGIAAHSLEFEPHLRTSSRRDSWIYPILRYHTQDGSDYWGAPRTFDAGDEFYTADGDLGEFDSDKIGVGYRTRFAVEKGWLRTLRSVESRLTSYSRDDGLDALSLSLAVGWRF